MPNDHSPVQYTFSAMHDSCPDRTSIYSGQSVTVWNSATEGVQQQQSLLEGHLFEDSLTTIDGQRAIGESTHQSVSCLFVEASDATTTEQPLVTSGRSLPHHASEDILRQTIRQWNPLNHRRGAHPVENPLQTRTACLGYVNQSLHGQWPSIDGECD